MMTGFWIGLAARLWQGWLARICLLVLAAYGLILLAGWLGWPGARWNEEVGVSYARPALLAGADVRIETALPAQVLARDSRAQALDPLAPRMAEVAQLARQYQKDEIAPSATLALGGDKWGRDIVLKTLRASQVSITIGLLAASIAVLIGVALGAVGGFFGGKISDGLEWFYNVFTAMPYILLVLAFAAVLGRGVNTIIIVLALTGWTGTYRLIRAEYIKQRSLEYVQAAEAIGVSRRRQMFAHILPNVGHLALVQLSMLVVEFIKSEVVLSFLGFGVPVDSVSWGIMIAEVQQELVLGKWWQLAACVGSMSLFVVAFSLLTDCLRDALDPKGGRA